ncbi:hypothetical protein AC578_2517 [Pseudocercospora eumusae]|uniref:Cytochrome P450 n=1 Tax=Pseudocercospora eumusae TaxID=321146 RepID=A0A139GW15_9PEZI|nr:hypothetical protein AC578_2517 [Pseudocercospora eumusae]
MNSLLVVLFVILALPLHRLIIYLEDKKGLRRFPAPSIAGVSSLWRIWHNQRFIHYKAVHQAHLRLGSHVRISPDHISISDPRAIPDLYGHGKYMEKAAWYDAIAAPNARNMVDAREPEHGFKRKLLAHAFAQKTILDLEPVFHRVTANLFAYMTEMEKAGEAVNMKDYLNYFTIDVLSELVWGKSMHCIRRRTDMVDIGLIGGKPSRAPFISSVYQMQLINTMVGFNSSLTLRLKKWLTRFHPYRKGAVDFDRIISHWTNMRQESDEPHPDLFGKLISTSKGEPTGLTQAELLTEVNLLMSAGTDTSTAALENTVFFLCKHPKIQDRLRKELDDAMEEPGIPSWRTVSNIPYLRAVIDESLRLRAASRIGLPRIVPPGGRVIAGQYIPGDVTVSVPIYTVHLDREYFEEPEKFNPDRWITGDKVKMNKAYMPFSIGPRACIGRNIALFEQLILIGALVSSFELRLADETLELRCLERFNACSDDLFVFSRRRFNDATPA